MRLHQLVGGSTGILCILCVEFSLERKNQLAKKLPFILGRDFAGVVKAVGDGVKHLKPGDEVMGVVRPQSVTGSFTQFIVVPSDCVVMKPTNLTMIEAASIPYAGLTAWAGWKNAGGLGQVSNGKHVLVMGAAGGVGSIAIQLAKIWGSKVII